MSDSEPMNVETRARWTLAGEPVELCRGAGSDEMTLWVDGERLLDGTAAEFLELAGAIRRLAAPLREVKGARNAGRRWTDDDDQALVAAYEQGTPMRALARNLGRSIGSVRARLVLLGHLDDPSAVRFPLSG